MTSLSKTRIASVSRRFSLLKIISQMRGIRRQRHALAELEDHQLHDLGLSREQAIAESRRKPWDAPANWRIGGQ